MEELDLNALRALLCPLLQNREDEQVILPSSQCPRCSAPIAGGILALHRHCPARQRASVATLSRSRSQRKGRRPTG